MRLLRAVQKVEVMAVVGATGLSLLEAEVCKPSSETMMSVII